MGAAWLDFQIGHPRKAHADQGPIKKSEKESSLKKATPELGGKDKG